MAVASAGPYASLHLAPDRQPRQYPTTLCFTGLMPFVPPNQQRQSTEGTDKTRQGQGYSFNQPPRPTQPPTLGGTGNKYQPKCGDAVRLGVKAVIPVITNTINSLSVCHRILQKQSKIFSTKRQLRKKYGHQIQKLRPT